MHVATLQNSDHSLSADWRQRASRPWHVPSLLHWQGLWSSRGEGTQPFWLRGDEGRSAAGNREHPSSARRQQGKVADGGGKPALQLAAPSWGERRPTPVSAGTPCRTCTQNLLHSTARWPSGTPGEQVTSPTVKSQPTCDQPAAVPRPQMGLTGLPTRERRREGAGESSQ